MKYTSLTKLISRSLFLLSVFKIRDEYKCSQLILIFPEPETRALNGGRTVAEDSSLALVDIIRVCCPGWMVRKKRGTNDNNVINRRSDD